MSLSRNVTGREFQRHGPATEKLLSVWLCARVCVCAVADLGIDGRGGATGGVGPPPHRGSGAAPPAGMQGAEPPLGVWGGKAPRS